MTSTTQNVGCPLIGRMRPNPLASQASSGRPLARLGLFGVDAFVNRTPGRVPVEVARRWPGGALAVMAESWVTIASAEIWRLAAARPDRAGTDPRTWCSATDDRRLREVGRMGPVETRRRHACGLGVSTRQATRWLWPEGVRHAIRASRELTIGGAHLDHPGDLRPRVGKASAARGTGSRWWRRRRCRRRGRRSRRRWEAGRGRQPPRRGGPHLRRTTHDDGHLEGPPRRPHRPALWGRGHGLQHGVKDAVRQSVHAFTSHDRTMRVTSGSVLIGSASRAVGRASASRAARNPRIA